jgi:hypothetical protein
MQLKIHAEPLLLAWPGKIKKRKKLQASSRKLQA